MVNTSRLTGPIQTAAQQTINQSAVNQKISPDVSPQAAETSASEPPASDLPGQHSVALASSHAASPHAANSLIFPSANRPANTESSLQTVIGRVDSDMRGFLQAVSEGNPPPQLNLENGLNYSLTQIFSANNSQDVNAVVQALNQAATRGPGGSISENYQEALQRVGLMLHDGKVYNLANRREVSAQELGNLAQIANHRLTSLTSQAPGARLLAESGAEQQMREVGPLLQQATARLDGMRQIQDLIASNTTEITRKQEELAQTNESLQEQLETVEDSKTVLDQAENKLTTLVSIQGRFSGQAQGTPSLQPGDQAVLAEYGLKIVTEGDQTRITGLNGELTSEQVSARLSQEVENQRQLTAVLRGKLQTETDELTVLTEKATDQEAALTGLMDQNDALMDNYRYEAQLAQKEMDELNAQRDQMTPEQLRQLDGLNTQAQELKSRATELMAQAQRANELGRATALSARDLRNIARSLLPALADQLARDIANREVVPNQTGPTATDLQLLKEMLAQVQESEATLNLAPRPATVDVKKMLSEWTDLLQEYSTRFEKSHKHDSNQRQVQTSFSDAQNRQVRRAAEYHSNQLKKLDSNNLERMEQVLRETLKDLHQQASASLPVTSEGNR